MSNPNGITLEGNKNNIFYYYYYLYLGHLFFQDISENTIINENNIVYYLGNNN